MISNIPSNLANLVAPFLPPGLRPVGQETAENRNSTLKPVEQLAKTADARVQMQYQKEKDEQEAYPEQDEAEEPAPDTPDAQRLAGDDNRKGRNFDQLV